MFKCDIIIPTCKKRKQLHGFVKKLKESISDEFRIIPTCYQASAATNRNMGLIKVEAPIVIMVDDDIKGFYPGWADRLIQPLEDDSVVMVSARLTNTDGSPAVMMNIKPVLDFPVVIVPDRMLPSACIAFHNDGTRFDEIYEGAGFEDTDFCMQLNEKYPSKKYLIHNEVKLIHDNERKGQQSGQLGINQMIFQNKWKHRLCV